MWMAPRKNARHNRVNPLTVCPYLVSLRTDNDDEHK